MLTPILFRIASLLFCIANNIAMHYMFSQNLYKLQMLHKNSRDLIEQHLLYLTERNKVILQQLEISPLEKLTYEAIPYICTGIYIITLFFVVQKTIWRFKMLCPDDSISILSSLRSIGDADSPYSICTLDSYHTGLLESISIIEEIRRLRLESSQTFGLTPYTENSIAYQLTTEALINLLTT